MCCIYLYVVCANIQFSMQILQLQSIRRADKPITVAAIADYRFISFTLYRFLRSARTLRDRRCRRLRKNYLQVLYANYGLFTGVCLLFV
jgi:hypothetical protein